MTEVRLPHRGFSVLSRLAFATCCCLTVLPFFFVTFPPAVDLPQHAAQLAMAERLDDPKCNLTAEFELSAGTPYLLAYGFALLLGQLLPVTLAVKATLALAVLGVPLGFTRLVRALRLPSSWSFLGFPLAFGYSIHWGFLAYAFAVPLGFLYLAMVVAYAERPTRARGVGLAVFSLGLFLAHALVALFAVAVAVVVVIARSTNKGVSTRLLPFVILVPVALYWGFGILQQRSDVRHFEWVLEGGRAWGFFAWLVGTPGGLFASLAGAFILAWPRIAGARLSQNLLEWLPFYGGVVWFLAAPEFVFGTAELFGRFHVFLPALLLLVLRAPEIVRPRLAFVPIVLAGLSLIAVSYRWMAFERETIPFRMIIAAAASNERAYSLVLDSYSEVTGGATYLHFPVWYQSQGGCLVEPSFARSFQTLIRYRDGSSGPLPLFIEWQQREASFQRHLGDRYRFVIARAADDPRADALATIPARLVASAGQWWLFDLEAAGDGALVRERR